MPGALPVGFVGLLGFFGLGMDEAKPKEAQDMDEVKHEAKDEAKDARRFFCAQLVETCAYDQSKQRTVYMAKTPSPGVRCSKQHTLA